MMIDSFRLEPEDTVSCSHDVETSNNSSSTDVIEGAVVI